MVGHVLLLAPHPEGEHKAAADKAPGGDGKDAADEKMEGKRDRRVRVKAAGCSLSYPSQLDLLEF